LNKNKFWEASLSLPSYVPTFALGMTDERTSRILCTAAPPLASAGGYTTKPWTSTCKLELFSPLRYWIDF